MHDIHQAIDVLRDMTGQPDLALGAGDHFEIVFDGTPVGFVAVDRRHLELVTLLTSLGTLPDAPTLLQLMTANYLGTATDAARLAVDPARQRVVLCERLDLTVLDANGLRDRIAGFLAVAAVWNGATGRELAAGPVPPKPDLATGSHFLIRG